MCTAGVLIALLGEREARSPDPGSDRRAALTRSWAGFLPVLWLMGGATPGSYGATEASRFLAGVLLLAVAIVLVLLWIGTRARAYLLSAAVAMLGILLAVVSSVTSGIR